MVQTLEILYHTLVSHILHTFMKTCSSEQSLEAEEEERSDSSVSSDTHTRADGRIMKMNTSSIGRYIRLSVLRMEMKACESMAGCWC